MSDPGQVSRHPERRAREIRTFGSLLPGVVIALILVGFTWVGALVALVIVAGGLYAWLTLAGERLALAGLHTHPADPVAEARLINLLEGLCISAGLRPPGLLVTTDTSCNLLVAGRRTEDAVVVVTQGLLDHLNRIELEGILAEGVMQVRQGDVVLATVAVATFGLASRVARSSPAHEEAADQAAASLTHYPPALARALDTMAEHGTEVATARPAAAHLWLADPRPGAAGALRLPLAERAAGLRDL